MLLPENCGNGHVSGNFPSWLDNSPTKSTSFKYQPNSLSRKRAKKAAMELLLSPVPVAVVEPCCFEGIPGHVFLLKCLKVSIFLIGAL